MAYVKCGTCKQQAFANARGQILIHTTTVYGGSFGQRPIAVVCNGATKGARP